MAVKKTVKQAAKKAVAKRATGKKGAVKKKGRKTAAGKAARPSRAGGSGFLSARDLDRIKGALLELRERINGQVASLHGDSLRRNDRVNVEEDGSDAFERQFMLNLASSEQDSLYAIDEALRRIEEGAYGVCSECSGKIEKPRLQALPFVTTCVPCQSRLEKTGLAKRRAI